jgi:xanthine/CO dehydrogenase XdhC/CoxF family maturation factor
VSPFHSSVRFVTSINVPIRSHTPEEIAISIAAEIVKVRNSGTGG